MVTADGLANQPPSLALERQVNKRQLQAAATEAQLLRAACEVFELCGYRAATVGAITERAATAHGTFYLYFKNKDDIFRRVMTLVTDELFAEAAANWEADHVEGVTAAIRGFLRVFTRHPGLWRALLEATLQNQSLAATWLDIRRHFIDRMAENFRRQQQLGEMRPFDPALGASALGSMIEWFAFTHFVVDEPPESDVLDAEIDRAVAALTDLFIHAVHGAGGGRVTDAD